MNNEVLSIPKDFRRAFLQMLLLLCLALSGCADGLVLEAVPHFDQPSLVLPTQAPTPEPSPVTALEHTQYQLRRGRKYLPYLGPLLAALLLFALFFRFLRLIYELSTTSPEI